MVDERLTDAFRRLQELSVQLQRLASLYRAFGATEIGEEFQRLARVEVQPVLHLLSEVING